MPKAAKGRIVHVLVDPAHNNWDDSAPAVITHVFGEPDASPATVNLRVLHDGPTVGPEGRNDWLTSVQLHESRAALEEHCAITREQLGVTGSDHGAFWPPHI